MKGISLDKIVSIEARKHDIGEAMATMTPDQHSPLAYQRAQNHSATTATKPTP